MRENSRIKCGGFFFDTQEEKLRSVRTAGRKNVGKCVKRNINAGGSFRHTEEKNMVTFFKLERRELKPGMHWEFFDELSRF
jgi:hypothetical protein